MNKIEITLDALPEWQEKPGFCPVSQYGNIQVESPDEVGCIARSEGEPALHESGVFTTPVTVETRIFLKE